MRRSREVTKNEKDTSRRGFNLSHVLTIHDATQVKRLCTAQMVAVLPGGHSGSAERGNGNSGGNGG